jgi:cytoskeletal protein RodZ
MTAPTSSKDALLDHYEQAKALQPNALPDAPSAATRERIMRAAREQATLNAIESIAFSAYSIRADRQKHLNNGLTKSLPVAPAANDVWWNIKAVASLAVMGLSALLWWQFEQGTPEEQQAAKSSLPSSATVVAAAPALEPTPALASQPPAPATKASPAMSPVDAPTAAPTSAPAERARAIRQVASPQAAAPLSSPASQADTAAKTVPTPATADAPPVTQSVPATITVPPNIGLRQYVEAQATANAASAAPPSQLLQHKSSEIASAPAAARSAAPAAPAARPLIPSPDALFSAIAARQAQTLQQALAQGASPNARNQEGQPALSQAVLQRWPEGVRILLAAGADKNAKNNKGQTAADLALELGDTGVAELLATPR